jgi:DNA-binding XRE family transcriptional regulator
MYQLRDFDKVSIINQSELARKVGINQATLNRIFNQKQSCSKVLAYAIVKAINENNEILDYFEIIKKGE